MKRRYAIAASLASVAAVVATSFAPAASASRRPHCAAIPTGTPGTFVVVCSSARA
jgi:hypothetical protein